MLFIMTSERKSRQLARGRTLFAIHARSVGNSPRIGATRRHFRVSEPTPLSRAAFPWDSPEAGGLRAQPGLKFVARRGDPWGLRSSLAFRSTSVRSLGSFALARSAPVVEVDAKVGVSREKGVSGACLAALPVLPVIPNFLASTRASRGWRSRVRSRPSGTHGIIRERARRTPDRAHDPRRHEAKGNKNFKIAAREDECFRVANGICPG